MKYLGFLLTFIFGVYTCIGDQLAQDFSQISHDKQNEFEMEKRKKIYNHFKKASEELVTFKSRESLNSDKLITRKGILIKRPNAKATVLISHGFMCDKFDVSFLHMIFENYNSMIFDFRAHGEDIQGQCCTFGRDEAYDVAAAAKFVKSHPDLKDKPLIAYGFSMGAVAAIIAQAQDNKLFDAMILDCPFDSSDKLLARGIDQMKINVFGYEMSMPGCSLLKSYAYSPYIQSILKTMLRTFTKMDATEINTCICPVYPEEAIKYISIPVFIIGCVNDDKAPEEAVISVYNGAKGFKRLWLTGGRRHFDTIFYKMHEYFYRVRKFIEMVLDGSIAEKKQQKIIRDIPTRTVRVL